MPTEPVLDADLLNDDRLKPHAYIRTGDRVFEVLSNNGRWLTLQHMVNGQKIDLPLTEVLTPTVGTWTLVRSAQAAWAADLAYAKACREADKQRALAAEHRS